MLYRAGLSSSRASPYQNSTINRVQTLLNPFSAMSSSAAASTAPASGIRQIHATGAKRCSDNCIHGEPMYDIISMKNRQVKMGYHTLPISIRFESSLLHEPLKLWPPLMVCPPRIENEPLSAIKDFACHRLGSKRLSTTSQ